MATFAFSFTLFILGLSQSAFAQTPASVSFEHLLCGAFSTGCSFARCPALQTALNNMSQLTSIVSTLVAEQAGGGCRAALESLQTSACSSSGSSAMSPFGNYGMGGGMMMGSSTLPGCPGGVAPTSPPYPPNSGDPCLSNPALCGPSGGVPSFVERVNRCDSLDAEMASLVALLAAESDPGSQAMIRSQLTQLRLEQARLTSGAPSLCDRARSEMSAAEEEARLAAEAAAAAARDAEDAASAASRAAEDTEVASRRARAVTQLSTVADGLTGALHACRGESNAGAILGALAGPAASLASNMSGMDVGAASALATVGNLISEMIGAFTPPTDEERVLEGLNDSLAPAAYTCAMERVTQRYCETQDLSSFFAVASVTSDRASCVLSTGHDSLAGLGDLIQNIHSVSSQPFTAAQLEALQERASGLQTYAQNAVAQLTQRLRLAEVNSLVSASVVRELRSGLEHANLLAQQSRGIVRAIHGFQTSTASEAEARREFRATLAGAGLHVQDTPDSAHVMLEQLRSELTGVMGVEVRELVRPGPGHGVSMENAAGLYRLNRALFLGSALGGPFDEEAIGAALGVNASNLNALSGLLMGGSRRLPRLIENLRRRAATTTGDPALRASFTGSAASLCSSALSLPDEALSLASEDGRRLREMCGGVEIVAPNFRGSFTRALRELGSGERRCLTYQQMRSEAERNGRSSTLNTVGISAMGDPLPTAPETRSPSTELNMPAGPATTR